MFQSTFSPFSVELPSRFGPRQWGQLGEPPQCGLVIAGQLFCVGRRQVVLEFGEGGSGRLIVRKGKALDESCGIGTHFRHVETDDGVEGGGREVTTACRQQCEQVIGFA